MSLIEHEKWNEKYENENMKNTFFEKSYAKCSRKTSLRPYYKYSKLSISLDQQSEIQSVFTVCPSQNYLNISKLRCWPLAFYLISGTSLLASFPAQFLKKNISHVIFY